MTGPKARPPQPREVVTDVGRTRAACEWEGLLPKAGCFQRSGAIPEFLIGGRARWTVNLPDVSGAGRGWEGVGVRGRCQGNSVVSAPRRWGPSSGCWSFLEFWKGCGLE